MEYFKILFLTQTNIPLSEVFNIIFYT